MANIAVESWIWYSVAVSIVVARYVSRFILVRSIRKLSWEDCIMAFVVCCYTVLIVLLNIVMDVNTNLIAPDDIPKLTPQDIADRTRGSKLVIVVEQMMCATIWLCKACLLLLYYKLTFGLKANLACKLVGAYVAINFVIMEILYFGVWCRPFKEAWITPTANEQCATQTHHLTVNLIFNLTSDIMILSIPLPLLVRSRIPQKHKLALILLFSLGGFVMLSAVLSKVFSFEDPFSSAWIFWYTREASTAIIVTNMPHCWALLRRVFHLKSFADGQSATTKATPSGWNSRYGQASVFANSTKKDNRGSDYGLRSDLPPRSFLSSITAADRRASKHYPLHSRSESQERITTIPENRAPLEIWQDVQFRVQSSRMDESDAEEGQVRNIDFVNGLQPPPAAATATTITTHHHTREEMELKDMSTVKIESSLNSTSSSFDNDSLAKSSIPNANVATEPNHPHHEQHDGSWPINRH